MESRNPGTMIFETLGTLSNGSSPGQYNGVVILNHHIPRTTYISKDQNNIQSLISRAGTGGGNVPLIMIKEKK